MCKVDADDKVVNEDVFGFFTALKTRFAYLDKFYLRKHFMLEDNERLIIKDKNETELR